MPSGKLATLASVLLMTTSALAAGPRNHRGPTSPKLFKARTAPSKPRVQAAMEPERATQIEAGLIKAGYLNGTPSGTWDAEAQDAMKKLQADNGYQTKFAPDARALIKLGLGPNERSSVSLAASDSATAFEPAATEVACPALVPANQ